MDQTQEMTIPPEVLALPARQYEPGTVWADEPPTISLGPLLAYGWKCVKCSRFDQAAGLTRRRDLGPASEEMLEIPAMHGWMLILKRHERRHGVEWSAAVYLWIPDPAFA